MQIELNNGKTVEFDEIEARARIHKHFDALEVCLRALHELALEAKTQADKDVKDSYYTLSSPHYEFLNLANEAKRHIRNIEFWREEDYPLDGTNPWG